MLAVVENSSGQPISETPPLEGGGGTPDRRGPASTVVDRIREGASRLAVESPDVVVDCRALDQLGGKPLPVLLALAAEVESRGGRLTLEDAGPIVMRLITLGGLWPKPTNV
jgi:hypothetical protein